MQTADILRKRVSFYVSLGQKECFVRTLFAVLNDIRKGVYADIILKLRNRIDDNLVYRKWKKRLPSICFCGIFWNGHYKHDISLYTNLLVVDIDHIKDSKSEIRKILIGDSRFVAVWDSVSGCGLKALLYLDYSCKVIPENLWIVHEKCAFPQVRKYMRNSLGITIDPNGGDVTRHCFVSFDPDIFLRKEFEPFHVSISLSEAEMAIIRKQYLSRRYISGNTGKNMHWK